jgi:hypothetical protein
MAMVPIGANKLADVTQIEIVCTEVMIGVDADEAHQRSRARMGVHEPQHELETPDAAYWPITRAASCRWHSPTNPWPKLEAEFRGRERES